MTKKRIALWSLAVLVVAVVVLVARQHYLHRPAAFDPEMQLAPYHPGMSLRQIYESFPDNGAQQTRLRLLQDNTLAWSARWELLAGAKHSIDVSYFILKQDVFGMAFLGHLLHKAEQGVKVRILLDAYGSKLSRRPEGNDLIDTLVNTGNVDVRMFRPLYTRALEGLLNLSLAVTVASEHDKILVVDGERAITGGRNIATEYFAQPDEAEMVFTDLGVEIDNATVVAALRAAFETQYLSDSAQSVTRERLNLASQRRILQRAYRAMDAWVRQGRLPQTAGEEAGGEDEKLLQSLRRTASLKGALERPPTPYFKAETRVLDSTTRFKAPDDVITQAVTRLVKSAREEIFIQNPYVVIPDEAIDVLRSAAQHEVPVILFTNSPASADSVVSQAFFLEQWPKLLAGVSSLKLYANAEQQMIHSKLASFDHVLSLVGTYNLSPLSMATNSEVVLAIWSRELADELTREPRRRLAAGKPKVYRYAIERNPDGSPRLDEDGEPVVAFGPEDHVDLDDMKKLEVLRKALQTADLLPGVSSFF